MGKGQPLEDQLGLEATCTESLSARRPEVFSSSLPQFGPGPKKVEVKPPKAGSGQLWPRDWGTGSSIYQRSQCKGLAKTQARWGK